MANSQRRRRRRPCFCWRSGLHKRTRHTLMGAQDRRSSTRTRWPYARPRRRRGSSSAEALLGRRAAPRCRLGARPCAVPGWEYHGGACFFLRFSWRGDAEPEPHSLFCLPPFVALQRIKTCSGEDHKAVQVPSTASPCAALATRRRVYASYSTSTTRPSNTKSTRTSPRCSTCARRAASGSSPRCGTTSSSTTCKTRRTVRSSGSTISSKRYDVPLPPLASTSPS